MKAKIYTSLYLSENLKSKLDQCVTKLGVDQSELLSVLCYKAATFVCSEARCFRVIEYQERGGDYEITPVCFFATDHEFMHANRYTCKISVSKLLACAMVLFLDEIMEKGINHKELARLQVIKNSYKSKTYTIRNYTFTIIKNEQFEEYITNMRIGKKPT